QDWQAWSNLGRHLTETGASEEAEEVLRRAATLAGPDATDPHLRLAELYLATGRPTTALVHSERAVTLSGSAEAFYLRGRGYYDVDEPDKAEEDFRRAVLADSRHVRARGAIGVIRAEKGDLQAAAENFRQVVAMDPTNAAARENLARAEALHRQLGFEGAAVAPPG
ncbi:MAG: tetratricopeptide repeat protein, partial [Myxococcota bacterium]|nr:tetratricopeptide repeat protein [Myxococcota bacterium]MEC8423475.1 tetratricopeptide repeat protein [Myxococcota bacterium]